MAPTHAAGCSSSKDLSIWDTAPTSLVARLNRGGSVNVTGMAPMTRYRQPSAQSSILNRPD
jgi:hypothetical protein